MLRVPQSSAKDMGSLCKLSYSRVSYREITPDQKVSTLTAGITRAFAYFGGVPRRLKIDNLRAAILTNQHFDLEFQQDFLEWANHYGTVIVPCTPYHPEQKGKSGVRRQIREGELFRGADLHRPAGSLPAACCLVACIRQRPHPRDNQDKTLGDIGIGGTRLPPAVTHCCLHHLRTGHQNRRQKLPHFLCKQLLLRPISIRRTGSDHPVEWIDSAGDCPG